jgi:hypothetical protein
VSLALTSRRAALLPGRWVSNELWRRARAVPSLDLRFAENKSLVDSVSGQSLITFTRASTGTYVDSNGVIRSAANDAPRFDHNPLTGESLGLLVEEQRTNLLLQSEDFSTTWVAARLTLDTDAVASPDGSISADKIIPDIEDSPSHYMRQLDASTLDNTTFTFSVYAKAGELSFVRLQPVLRDVSQPNSSFNLSTGEIRSGAGLTTGRAYLGNGWYRLWITFNSGTGSFGIQPRVFVDVDLTGLTSFIGDGTSGLYIWGAQLEVGDFPTSYIPTTTAAATRTADVASITTAGGNVRSLFTSFRSPASGTRPVVSLDDNTANERIEILTSGTDPKLLVTDGGSAVADLDAGTVTANVLARIAARFNTDDYAVSINGGTSQLDAAGALPTVNRIRIGNNQAGGYLSGPIARVTAWDSTLPLLPSISQ